MPTTASAEDIKVAYRRLMKQTHPDAGGSAALADTVREAYELLSLPESREAYDEACPRPSRRWLSAPSPRRRVAGRRRRLEADPVGDSGSWRARCCWACSA